jgi:hypothetical protein
MGSGQPSARNSARTLSMTALAPAFSASVADRMPGRCGSASISSQRRFRTSAAFAGRLSRANAGESGLRVK